MIYWFVFVLCRIVDFRKIYFWFFFNDQIRIFESGGKHSKEHKNLYLKKNNFSSYRGSFVITKNFFFFYLFIYFFF